MQYGYFDDQAREYVITRPDTPAPWANYLGSPEYGALISNNAGGYSFVKSGANGRILRYVGSAEKDQGISGPRPGNRWESRWMSLRASAVMGRAIPKCWRIMAVFTAKRSIMCLWAVHMRSGS